MFFAQTLKSKNKFYKTNYVFLTFLSYTQTNKQTSTLRTLNTLAFPQNLLFLILHSHLSPLTPEVSESVITQIIIIPRHSLNISSNLSLLYPTATAVFCITSINLPSTFHPSKLPLSAVMIFL